MDILQVAELFEDFIAHNRAGGAKNNILFLFLFLTHMHATYIDFMVSEGGCDRTDDTRSVFIFHEEYVPLGNSLQIKVVDAKNSWKSLAEDGS